jgi:hypothetical protein
MSGPAAVVLTLHLILTGCASERVITQQGESDPIAWEATGFRQSLEEQGNRMKWSYTLVLRNTGQATVSFDQVTVIAAPLGAGIFSGGHQTHPYTRTLRPGAEIREPRSYSLGCTQSCDPQWVRQMLRTGVTQFIEFSGRDETGRAVKSTVRIQLDSTVGTSASAPEPEPAATVTRQVPIRQIGQIAGRWRGTLYGSGGPLATVTIERDGTYAWFNDRESGSGTLSPTGDGRMRFDSVTGRRGTVTLYEDDGRRRLMIDYEGASWQGRLAPLE